MDGWSAGGYSASSHGELSASDWGAYVPESFRQQAEKSRTIDADTSEGMYDTDLSS